MQENSKILKVGDRVYFDSTTSIGNGGSRGKGFGTITEILDHGYIVLGYKRFFIEPQYGEILILEEIYNSPLYQAMKEE